MDALRALPRALRRPLMGGREKPWLAALLAVALLTSTAALWAGENPARTPADSAAGEVGTKQETSREIRVTIPNPSDKALRYYRSGNAWWVVNVLWGFAVPLLILVSGLSVRLRDAANRWTGGRWYLALLGYFASYITLVALVDLPFAYLQGFARPHAYGLSEQLLSKWVGDMLKGYGIGLLAAALFLWIPYLLLRRSPNRWWLYTSIAAVPFFLFVMLVSPIWVAPLFNDFGPMQDKALEARILDLAARTGVQFDRVFEVDKSVDTQQVNAYVSGFASSKRIVLWDTLLEKLDDDQVVFVMGHELGHYVLGHIRRSIVVFSLFVLVALYATHRLSQVIFRRFGERLGIRSLADPAALPILLILLDLIGLASAPASLAYSRYQEHEADQFALELTQDNSAGASAFAELQLTNLSNPFPGPLYKLMRASHPPIGERVEFCNDYRPWERGEPSRFSDYMQP